MKEAFGKSIGASVDLYNNDVEMYENSSKNIS